jgi:phosphatidylinositol 4-kinase
MRHLVALPFEVFTPAAIAAGIDVWTWIISEKPEYEIGVMMEINSAWLATVRFERGMFSTSQKSALLSLHSPRDADVFFDSYDDPFFHQIKYTPTDKEEIDRGMASAKRLLAPHVLILQMLISRFQAARYRRPGLMLLIQRLVLISARAHRYMRLDPFSPG